MRLFETQRETRAVRTISPRGRGWTLVELLAVLVIIVVIMALVAPAIARASRQNKVTACANNLKRLYQARLGYASKGPSPLGWKYWQELTEGGSPFLDASALHCPVRSSGRAGECHYLGPSMEPDKMAQEDPLGCDEDYNHSKDLREGGHILRKSGEVVLDNNMIWRESIRRCRP
jgi:prepilin-type N-terminal cleavage/methylation domain-containing protein